MHPKYSSILEMSSLLSRYKIVCYNCIWSINICWKFGIIYNSHENSSTSCLIFRNKLEKINKIIQYHLLCDTSWAAVIIQEAGCCTDMAMWILDNILTAKCIILNTPSGKVTYFYNGKIDTSEVHTYTSFCSENTPMLLSFPTYNPVVWRWCIHS